MLGIEFFKHFFWLASPFNGDLLRKYGDFNGFFITFQWGFHHFHDEQMVTQPIKNVAI
jgi:hypothetical protein